MPGTIPEISEAMQAVSRVRSGHSLVAIFCFVFVAGGVGMAFSPLPEPQNWIIASVLGVCGILVGITSPWLLRLLPPSDEIKLAQIEHGFMEVDGKIVSLTSLMAVEPPASLQPGLTSDPGSDAE